MHAPFGRILTAMVTPFAADGSVDYAEAARIATHLVGHGSDGVVVHGTTGEASTLTDEEKLGLVEAVAGALPTGTPVVAGTGSNDTAHSADLTRAAVRLGATAILAVTPYYNKPPIAGIEGHMRAIAAAAGDVPIVLYNIPQRVVVRLSTDDLARLAEIDTVIAVKQAVEEPEDARRIVEDGRLALYAGNDDLLRPFAELGGVGGICVASHVAGREMQELQRAVEDGDTARADALEAELLALYEGLSCAVNPIPIKCAMAELGFAVGEPRLPLVAATEAERSVVRAALVARGLVA